MSERGGISGQKRTPAFKEALRALARRDHFSTEIRQKLLGRDHPVEEVEAAIATLIEMGYIDDKKRARRFAATHLAKGRGPSYIASRLSAMGISGESAQVDRAEERASLLQLLSKKKIDPGSLTDLKDRAKILRFLRGRGYRPQVISSVFSGADYYEE